MTKFNRRLIFAIPLFLYAKIYGQDSLVSDSVKVLKEVEIVYQAEFLTPVTYINIKSDEIKSISVGQEPSFVISHTPSVTNYSDAGNTQGYSYFRLRGIDQTRINITLDGVPLNEPEDQGAYFSNYPDILNSVSKIQIQRGVGTSKNGVASYGGSIQLFAPDLTDSAKTTVGFGYGSFNSYRAFGEFNSGIKNTKGIYIRASQIHSDGYKYNSANNSQSLFLSGGLFQEKSIWKFSFLAGHQKNELAWLGVPDSLISIDRRTNSNQNEKDNFNQNLAQIQYRYFFNESSAIQSSIYYTFLKGDYDFNLNNFLGLPSTGEMFNYAFRSNLIGFFSNYTYSKKRVNLIAGIHLNGYDREHLGSEVSLGQIYLNTGYRSEASAFCKMEYQIDRVNFFADLQVRHSTFDYAGSVEFEELAWDFFNPKAGLTVKVKNNLIAYCSVGRSGREPTRNDLFGGSDDLLSDSSGTMILYNKPAEYVIDYELGLRSHSDKLFLDLNLYYMDFSNEIVLDGKFGPNGLLLTNSVEQSYRSGIELSVVYKFSESIVFSNSSSFNFSRIKEQGQEFIPVLTPAVILNQEVKYLLGDFEVGLSAKYQGKSFIDFANSTMVNSYFVLNGSLSYKFNRWQFATFVDNFTNSKYYSNGYVDFDGIAKYFVQAPINLYGSLKYSF